MDFIRTENKSNKSAGGIYYTTLALNSLKCENDEIFLCSQFDDKTYNYFSFEFEKINKKYLSKVNTIPKVHLSIFKDKEREELYENITNKLVMDFKDLNQFDGILINMITGYDITLDQLNQIRNCFNGIIYFDVHTFSRGLDENYKRNFRFIPEFNKWASCIDIIQSNQMELFSVSKRKSESEIVFELFEFGIKIVCVTKGKLGAKVYFNKSNETKSYFICR